MSTATTPKSGARARRGTPVVAPAEKKSKASATSREAAPIARAKKPRVASCKLVDADGTVTLITEAEFRVLKKAAELLASGSVVDVVRLGERVTTRHAAELLHVTHDWLLELLDHNEMRSEVIGKQRLVNAQDVLDYRVERDRRRKEGMRELMQLSQEYGEYEFAKP